MKTLKIFCTVTLLLLNSAFAADAVAPSQDGSVYRMEGIDYKYTKPKAFDFLTRIPKDGWKFLDNSFSSEYLGAWGIIAVSTGILIVYDQQITNQFQRFGRFTHLGNHENTVATLRVGGSALLRRPSDVGSLFYFFGDGWVTLGLAAGFLGTGYISNDTREMQVASQLVQGLLTTGIVTQLIKRTTGRESPIKATKSGGRWRFFPKTSDFQNNISAYDAFPSGHLAATMTAFTIISQNYSEYTWIKPVGYTMMTLLGYQMVNNSVHWISDYPLALGIGYMIGKTIVNNSREKLSNDPNQIHSYFTPLLDPGGKMGVAWILDY